MAAVASRNAADNEITSRRHRVCSLVDVAPWSVALIDSSGMITAISPSARRLLKVSAGLPAVAILPVDIDDATRARFYQALESASNNTPGAACVFQRLEPSPLEVEALPIVLDHAGWVSVTLHEPSRQAVVHELTNTLHRRLHSLADAGSLHEACHQLSEVLLPAGVSLAVIAWDARRSAFSLAYTSPPFETIACDERMLAFALQQSAPLFIDVTDQSIVHGMAPAFGARGHVLFLLPEHERRHYVLHLWGSSVSLATETAINTIAALIASLLARVIEREKTIWYRQALDALSDAARTIIAHWNFDDALHEICHRMMILLKADHASLYLPADDPNFLVCTTATGVANHLRDRTLPVIGSLIGRTFREGSTMFFPDLMAEAEMYRPFWEAHRLNAALNEPLRYHERVIGALSVGWYQAPELNNDHNTIIRRFAEFATAVVLNAQGRRTLFRADDRHLSFEQAEELVFTLAPDGTILRCNQSAADRVGAKPGMSFFEVVTPACEHEVRRYLQDASADRHLSLPWTFEMTGIQGQPITLETTVHLIRRDSSAIAIDLICRDVTARRAAEQEMQQLHLELTTLLRVSQAINRATDLDTVLSTILDIIVQAMAIRAATIILYDSESRLCIKHVHSISSLGIACHDRMIARLFQEEQEALAGGMSRVIDVRAMRVHMPDLPALQRLPDDVAYLSVTPLLIDGVVIGLLECLSTQRPFEMRDMELIDAIASQLVQAIRNAQTNQDMQETSLMNARLYREAEAMRAYLDAIIQNAPDVLIVCRLDMSMQPLNQEPLTPLGYQRHKLAGQSLLRLVPPDNRTTLTRAWLQVQQGESQRFEMDLLRADESRFTALVSFDLIPDYNEVLVVIKDVTKLRRLESQVRQHEKLAALGRLIAGVAHELNNPLAVILGLSQLQLGEDIPLSVRIDFEQIERAARRAAAIVHQLHAFAQPRALELVPLDLSLIIDETLQRLASRIATENVVVTVDLPPDLPHVLGELHQIEQVVFNITMNALQALALRLHGEPRNLCFSATVDAESVVLAVEDTGPGIAPEHLSRVFEPFFTTRDVGQGMGMGLAVVYSIVQQHRGEVWVESSQGVGTVFKVRLLRTNETQEEKTPSISIPRNLSILLVEDDDSVRTMVQRVLERLECRVDAVSKGEEALTRALTWNYALVITDLQMPGLDGVELYERLRVLKPLLRWLILTGDTMGERSHAFLQRTGLPLLHKPFTREQLIESIAVSLQQHT